MIRSLLKKIVTGAVCCLSSVAIAAAPSTISRPVDFSTIKTLSEQALSYDAFGDSITAGYASTTIANRYVGLVGKALGVSPINHGVSGAEAGDQESAIYAVTPTDTGSQYYSYMIGTNDGTFWGLNSGQVLTWHTVYQAELAWLALPARAKFLGQDTADIAYSGSGGSHWSASANFGGSMEQQTQTLGDTATYSTWGRCAYVAYGIDSVTTGGTFTITVDGTSYGTFYSQGAGQTGTIPARLGATHASGLTRICGLSLAVHTVVVTVTSASSAGNVVWLDWVGQPTGSQFANGPTVLAASPIRSLNASGDANVQPYSAFIQQDVSLLTSDSLNIAYVETAGYMVAPADFEWSAYTGYINGTTLTVTGVVYAPVGNPIGNISSGLSVLGPSSVTAGTVISALGTGTGGVGTYTVSVSQTVGSAGSPVTLYLGDGVHPSDSGHLHLAEAFKAGINTQFSARGRSASSAQASPLLQVIWGCGASLINTPVQGNVLMGGGYIAAGSCGGNTMNAAGYNNTWIGGRGNQIANGGTANTNNNFGGGGTQNSIQFGANNGQIGGTLNSVWGNSNFGGGGSQNSYHGTYSGGIGCRYGSDRSRIGVVTCGTGAFAALGAGQKVEGTLGASGSSTTPICVTTDGAAAGSLNLLNLPINTNSAILIVAHARDLTTPSKSYTAVWNGAHTIMVGGTLGSITLDGATTAVAPDSIKPSGTVTGASFSATVDTTNAAIPICFMPPTGNIETWHVGASITQLEVQ